MADALLKTIMTAAGIDPSVLIEPIFEFLIELFDLKGLIEEYRPYIDMIERVLDEGREYAGVLETIGSFVALAQLAWNVCVAIKEMIQAAMSRSP